MSYYAEVMRDNPIVYLRLDDNAASTTLADASGNGRTGNSTGNTNTMNTAAGLRAGSTSALTFNGSQGIQIASMNMTAYTVITVECWYYWTTSANNDLLILETGSAFTSSNGFWIDPNNSGSSNFVVGMGDSSGHTWLDGMVRPSLNAWHHLVVTFDRTTPSACVNTLYLDGAQVTLSAGAHTTLNQSTFPNTTVNVMGRNFSSLFAPAGSMLDEFAMYGSALSAARIYSHYASGFVPHNINAYMGVRVANGMSTGEKIR